MHWNNKASMFGDSKAGNSKWSPPVLLCTLLMLSSATFHTAHCRVFQAPQDSQVLQRRPGKLLLQRPSEGSALLTMNSGKRVTIEAALPRLGLKKNRTVGSMGWMLVDLAEGGDLTAKAEQLKKQGYTVEYDWVVRASRTPNDALWPKISKAMKRISAPQAWDSFTGNGDVTVCVIDSGINLSHPDLAPNVLSTSYNAIANVESPTAGTDDFGHGSHCAGTIGAVGNNGIGVAGIMWNVKLLSCKFLNKKGAGFVSDAIQCIHWCHTHNATVTSNSWGGSGYSRALKTEIQSSQNAGSLFVVAAGNNKRNIDRAPSYPSSYDLDNMIIVGAAVPRTDTRAYFSNYGASHVDLFAPGVNIYSTMLGSKYGLLSGTSMACPHVAGASALVWSCRPSLTAAQVKDVIMQSVDHLPALSGLCATGGRLNVSRALFLASRL